MVDITEVLVDTNIEGDIIELEVERGDQFLKADFPSVYLRVNELFELNNISEVDIYRFDGDKPIYWKDECDVITYKIDWGSSPYFQPENKLQKNIHKEETIKIIMPILEKELTSGKNHV